MRLASQPQSRVCEIAQGLTSTYSHTLARTHQDELRIPSNATGLPKRMQLEEDDDDDDDDDEGDNNNNNNDKAEDDDDDDDDDEGLGR